MPPVRLNTNYDALVIVLDETGEEKPSFFERELFKVFERQKILYYKTSKIDAEELYQNITKKIQDGEILFPQSQRIIFCNYLALNDLSEEWMENYRRRMDGFRSLATVRDGLQHYHVTFLRYQTVNPMGEKKKEIYPVLNRFWDPRNQMAMRHAEFLLYAGGFDTLDAQEKGVVRFLHILSEKDYLRMYDPTQYARGLFILSYKDYYEERALNCQKEIGAIEDWIKNKKDPDLTNFLAEIKKKAEMIMDNYRQEVLALKKWAGLYPVSILEYASQGFGPFKTYTRRSGIHPELQKEKDRSRDHYFRRLKDSSEKEEWFGQISNMMNYQDFQELEKAWDSNGLFPKVKQIVESCSAKLEETDIDLFMEIFKEWLDEFVKRKKESLKWEKQRKEDEKIRWEYERNLASQYPTLANCFANIKSGTTFQVPPAIAPAAMGEIVAVNSDIGREWMEKSYHIEGVEDANVVISDDIFPSEIQYLKFGRYISLNQEETEHDLDMVLR